MLVGEYNHTIDPKKRLSLPARFRKEVGKQVVITHGLDNCLFVYPMKEWSKIAEKLSTLSMGQSDTRGFNRFMLAGAMVVDIDALGRILVPDYLKDFAALKEKVAVVGVHTHIEIWDEDRWNTYKKQIEKNADALAQKLGEIGVI
ncbi:MAG: division/cell wall cluster transcriptional repressor MraZ [Candidatus Paceibacterota bacterium]|jgi:MraZ protein